MPRFLEVRWRLAILIFLTVIVANLVFFPQSEPWRVNNTAFTTVEHIKKFPWVKGTATLLASEFDNITVHGLARSEQSLLFDGTLAEFYAIETNADFSPIDLSQETSFAAALENSGWIRYQFETFCRYGDVETYCPVMLVWDQPAEQDSGVVDFDVVRIADGQFALIERQLLAQICEDLGLQPNERVPS